MNMKYQHIIEVDKELCIGCGKILAPIILPRASSFSRLKAANGTGILLRNVHIGQLHGLQLSVSLIVFIDHLCLADRKLEALPAHVLNEDGQMQLAAAGNLKAVGGICLLHTQAHICIQLPEQTLPDMAGGDEFPLLAGLSNSV